MPSEPGIQKNLNCCSKATRQGAQGQGTFGHEGLDPKPHAALNTTQSWAALLPAGTSLRDGTVGRQTQVQISGCMTWACGLIFLSLSFLICQKRIIPHSEICFEDEIDVGTPFNYHPTNGSKYSALR